MKLHTQVGSLICCCCWPATLGLHMGMAGVHGPTWSSVCWGGCIYPMLQHGTLTADGGFSLKCPSISLPSQCSSCLMSLVCAVLRCAGPLQVPAYLGSQRTSSCSSGLRRTQHINQQLLSWLPAMTDVSLLLSVCIMAGAMAGSDRQCTKPQRPASSVWPLAAQA